jgi:hypothetical protein
MACAHPHLIHIENPPPDPALYECAVCRAMLHVTLAPYDIQPLHAVMGVPK